MQVVYRRCCGLDVHKKSVTAAVLVCDEAGHREVRRKEFATHWQDLQRLRFWLSACRVEAVAMESTGVYWKAIWNVLEGHFPLVLANPYFVRNFPGEKTDAKDSAWLANLLAHGLIRSSFVPPREIRDLRDLTRYRVKLKEEYNRVHNRIGKVLEDTNLKLGNVASDIWGATGRAILRRVIAGEERPEWLADWAQGTLRGKRAQLRLVLRGHVTDHHRFLLGELLGEVERIETQILRLDAELVRRMAPYEEALARLRTIPGVDVMTAWTLLAELGPDMRVFADAGHAASWAGLVPGNNESAGKRKSRRTRQGNRWLRRALTQSAWAVSRKKDCYLTACFYRRAARAGVKQAIVATAHQILELAYHLLAEGTVYREKGGGYFDQQDPVRSAQRLSQRLARLGYEVVLQKQEELVEPAAQGKRPVGRPRRRPDTQLTEAPG